MSLDVYLTVRKEEVYSANITHNLTGMAREAGLYEHLWRPDEIGVTRARQLIRPLRKGLLTLVTDPARFKALNPPNGWGDYYGLVRFVIDYLAAAKANRSAKVRVWR